MFVAALVWFVGAVLTTRAMIAHAEKTNQLEHPLVPKNEFKFGLAVVCFIVWPILWLAVCAEWLWRQIRRKE